MCAATCELTELSIISFLNVSSRIVQCESDHGRLDLCVWRSGVGRALPAAGAGEHVHIYIYIHASTENLMNRGTGLGAKLFFGGFFGGLFSRSRTSRAGDASTTRSCIVV
jgi:hypothetical protein